MAAEQHVRTLLLGLGEDVNREGLLDTPKRVTKAFKDMLRGYSVPLASALGTALFNEPIVSSGDADGGPGGLVLVRDIEFASLSDATLLPFHGRCHVAYVPSNGVVLGLSKLARLTKLAARRVQGQDALAARVMGALCGALAPAGAAVVVDALHLTYSAPAPERRVTVAAAGSMRGNSSSSGSSSSGSSSGLLEEALALLDLDVDLACARECAEPFPHTLFARAGAGASLLMQQQQQQQKGVQQQQQQQGAPCADGPVAPTTPDLSERDDSSSAASGCCDAASADGDGEPGDGDLPPIGADRMQAAVTALLSESGARDAHSPAMQAAARRYVMALLASTAGYHAPLPSVAAPAACGCGAGQQQQQTWQQQQQQQQQQVEQQQVEQQQQRQPWQEVHVPFVSQCEHHMLPFYGTVHIACTAPRQQQQRQQQQGGGACGALLARDAAEAIVAAFTQRLQVQERITQQVADAVAAATGAAGVLVVVRAAHMCMVARGVENHAGTTLTRAALGEFADSAALRAAFLKAVAARGNAGGSEAAAASTERSLVSPCSCCS